MSLIPTSRRALRHLAHWRSLGLPQIRVGVNLSSAELRRKDFAGHFLDAARLARIGSRIDVEISESTLLGDRADLHETLQKLRSEGVRVTLDDFGMVRPSLQCLAQFPVDRRRSWGLIPRAQVQIPPLKIDRSFVQSLSRNRRAKPSYRRFWRLHGPAPCARWRRVWRRWSNWRFWILSGAGSHRVIFTVRRCRRKRSSCCWRRVPASSREDRLTAVRRRLRQCDGRRSGWRVTASTPSSARHCDA